ncbi:Trimeric intracellular cation channel type A-like [Oopsacas minuta]|uniref:Trimeric intracellular cation channel type A-like n=1 Tax=Oopsacas minuta TaxID=111878 RepID=A0AAV7JD24_9METZ|nr:Trimeric intracellular cation channel type A-like [Oopsacas minuta]
MPDVAVDPLTTAVDSLHSAGEMLLEIDPKIHFIIHSILVAYKIRQSEKESRLFALKYPIASCATHFIVSLFGTILSNFLLGIPVIGVCTNPQNLFLSFLCWYLVFFSPWDTVFNLLNLLPLRIMLEILHEIKRAINVHLGVIQAAKVFPEAWTVMAIIGTIRGSGTNWGITFSRLITNSPLAREHELIKFVAATRLCLIMGVLFGLSQVGKFTFDPLAILPVLSTVMIAIRLGSLVYQWGDPFTSIQGILWRPFVILIQEEIEFENSGSNEVSQFI